MHKIPEIYVNRGDIALNRNWIIIGLTLSLLLMYLPQTMFLAENIDNLRIVVTFPFMIDDIRAILCEGDEVFSLVPSGIDPHEYQLTYGDIEVLTRTNIIISTAHTPFELRIKELISAGELNAKLVEIPSIPGLMFLKNPSTNALNYHGMLFHGYNYVAFLKYLSNVLSNIRPECASIYNNRVEILINRIERIGSSKPLRGLKAIVDTPVLQYLVSWLGANVTYILAAEHDVPVTPHDIDEAEKILETFRQEAVVVVTEDSLARDLLKELAFKYDANFLVIPNPITSTQSVLTYLDNIVKECQNLLTSKPDEGNVFNINLEFIVLIVATAVIVLVVVLLIPRVRI